MNDLDMIIFMLKSILLCIAVWGVTGVILLKTFKRQIAKSILDNIHDDRDIMQELRLQSCTRGCQDRRSADALTEITLLRIANKALEVENKGGVEEWVKKKSINCGTCEFKEPLGCGGKDEDDEEEADE